MTINFVHSLQAVQDRMDRHKIALTWRVRINAARLQKAQTLKEWCAEYGISYDNLIHIMNGRRVPSHENIKKVEAALTVTSTKDEEIPVINS